MRQRADRSRQGLPGVHGVGARTFPATLLLPFLRHAQRTGWSEHELAALWVRHGVRPPALDDFTSDVPLKEAFSIVAELCARSKDEQLGLNLAREAEASWMSLIGVMAMTMSGVREALTLGTDYGRRLHGARATLNHYLDERGHFHVERVRYPGDPLLPRHFVEAAVGAFVVLLRRFTGVAIQPIQVTFPHPTPADTRAHVELFGTRDLRFGSPLVGLVFPASVLDLRHQSADPILLAFLRRRADALIDERGGGVQLSACVRQGLREALERGEEASLERVAKNLGRTGRTLQRHLAEDGVSFSALLTHARCERALELLRRPGADLDDIAERIGLSDARSLRRVLKRRTGRTLSALRRP